MTLWLYLKQINGGWSKPSKLCGKTLTVILQLSEWGKDLLKRWDYSRRTDLEMQTLNFHQSSSNKLLCLPSPKRTFSRSLNQLLLWPYRQTSCSSKWLSRIKRSFYKKDRPEIKRSIALTKRTFPTWSKRSTSRTARVQRKNRRRKDKEWRESWNY